MRTSLSFLAVDGSTWTARVISVVVIQLLVTVQLADQASMRSPTSSLFTASSADTIKVSISWTVLREGGHGDHAVGPSRWGISEDFVECN